MSAIPCEQDSDLRAQIELFAEVLKTQAHRLGNHGLNERDFYNSGLFRGAVERVRGQFSASMGAKREFVQHVLNYMEDEKFIAGWDPTGDSKRNDYLVRLLSGRTAVIDLKGCLDGNNTNIFERPANADEFVIWSICTNLGADPRRNVWSGIHTRLSAEMISRDQRVDGVIVWAMACATIGRPCPKVIGSPNKDRHTEIGPFQVPPACIYLFPSTLPSIGTPTVSSQPIESVELLSAFHRCFNGNDAELNHVDFELRQTGPELMRKTTIRRAGTIQKVSEMSGIRRV